MGPEIRETYGYDRQLMPFANYREILDQEPGLMRHGIENEEIYKLCLGHPRAIVGSSIFFPGQVVTALPNELAHAVEDSLPISNKLFSALPSHYFFDLSTSPELIMRDRITLSESTTEKIFNGDPSVQNYINDEINAFVGNLGRKHSGDALNEYMFFSKYDLSPTHEKFSKPAEDFETANGFIISTRPEEIKKYIPEIVKLQADVFSAQAVQTGYFAGLSDEDTLAIIQNPEFIPIIARDKVTNEIAMCTLFSPDFTDFDMLRWINPSEVAKHIMDGTMPDCLTLPLIVVSRMSGLGLLKYAVQMAIHETVYRKRPETVGVMYESNPISVHITPRTIHGQIIRSGGLCLYKYSEVYFMSEDLTSANS